MFEKLEATKVFSLVMPGVLISVGTVGNLCALLTLLLGNTKRRPLNMILISLAISDIIALNTGYLTTWIRDINTINIPANYTTRIGVIGPVEYLPSFLFFVSSTLSAFLVCLMSIERFVAVWKVFKVHTFFTSRITILAISAITSISVIVFIPSFFTEKKEYANAKKGAYDIFGGRYLFQVSLVTCILPLLVIVPVNIGTCILLRNFKEKNKCLRKSGSLSENEENLRLSLVLIVAALSHIGFPTPNRIFNIINNYYRTMATNLDLFVYSYHMCKMNFTLNWVYYFFSTQSMRKEFIGLLQWKTRKPFQQQRTTFTTCSKTSNNRRIAETTI